MASVRDAISSCIHNSAIFPVFSEIVVILLIPFLTYWPRVPNAQF